LCQNVTRESEGSYGKNRLLKGRTRPPMSLRFRCEILAVIG
jgi:hypothetical protein